MAAEITRNVAKMAKASEPANERRPMAYRKRRMAKAVAAWRNISVKYQADEDMSA